ncbi:spondin-1-like, partial [Clavelina lepadiformis]|uniref:spondin-1-like n=1 Tax=Clavelina lepadiformis TaxID=159417 RepID=UPI00404103F2
LQCLKPRFVLEGNNPGSYPIFKQGEAPITVQKGRYVQVLLSLPLLQSFPSLKQAEAYSKTATRTKKSILIVGAIGATAYGIWYSYRQPIDCKVSEWTNWGNCDGNCGWGKTERSRKIIQTPERGGAVCPNLLESNGCFLGDCPINCRVSSWSAWSHCDKSCGTGGRRQTRTITQTAKFGGRACPRLAEVEGCHEKVCPVHCKVSDWSTWSDCNQSCGNGTQKRRRNIKHEARHGGTLCPAEDDLLETKLCKVKDCPIDCKVGNWSQWSECDHSCGKGTRHRQREIIQPAEFGGNRCQEELVETKDCHKTSCPIDCKVSTWSAWSHCDKSCGTGGRRRTRTITQTAKFGGRACPRLAKVEGCLEIACPVHCKVSDWSTWSDCNQSCGNGTQKRRRNIKHEARHGGTLCPAEDDLLETKLCNVKDCPIDCKVGSWSQWSECDHSCGKGTRHRQREIIQPAEFGGNRCQEKFVETKDCHKTSCPIDCKVSDWSDWSQCSQSCGLGVQKRERFIIEQARNGGKSCSLDGRLKQTKNCQLTGCPVDCKLSDWSKWGKCKTTAGQREQDRRRYVTIEAKNKGKSCREMRYEVRKCEEFWNPVVLVVVAVGSIIVGILVVFLVCCCDAGEKQRKYNPL